MNGKDELYIDDLKDRIKELEDEVKLNQQAMTVMANKFDNSTNKIKAEAVREFDEWLNVSGRIYKSWSEEYANQLDGE